MLNSYKFCFQKFCAFSVYYFLCTLLMIHIYIYILLHKYFHIIKGFPDGTGGKEPACHCKRPEVQFDPWVRKIWRKGHGNPLQYSYMENPMDRGSTVHRVAELTRLKRLGLYACNINCHQFLILFYQLNFISKSKYLFWLLPYLLPSFWNSFVIYFVMKNFFRFKFSLVLWSRIYTSVSSFYTLKK